MPKWRATAISCGVQKSLFRPPGEIDTFAVPHIVQAKRAHVVSTMRSRFGGSEEQPGHRHGPLGDDLHMGVGCYVRQFGTATKAPGV
jgi:hypothetical protein